MSDRLKAIFSKDIAESFRKVRDDERQKCRQEMQQALDKQREKIEGEWFLKVKEKESEMESLLLRMREMADRDKKITAGLQNVREIGIIQRRIASDLVYIAQRKHEEDTRLLQEFLRIQSEIQTEETKLIGIKEM